MTTWSRDRIHPWAHPSGRVREALTHQSTSALPGPKSRTRVTSLDLADTLVHGCQIFRVTHDPVEIPFRYHMTQSDVEYSLWRFPLGDPIFRVSTLVSPTVELSPTSLLASSQSLRLLLGPTHHHLRNKGVDKHSQRPCKLNHTSAAPRVMLVRRVTVWGACRDNSRHPAGTSQHLTCSTPP